MKIEMRRVGAIKPYAGNPRQNDAAVDAVARSIQEFGFRQPIVIDAKGVIICGHTRWKAALKLGLKSVPVHVARDLSPAKVRAYRIADNKTGDLSDWETDQLAAELGAMEDVDWEQYGFSEDELDALLKREQGPVDAEAQIDKAAELNKTWQVKLGDLWRIGEHRLLCGDATQAEDMRRLMGDDRAVCAFTDPPYGVSIGKKNVMLNTFQTAGRCLANLDMDDMPPKELGEMLLKAFTLWRGAMSDECAVFVCSPQGGGLGMMMMMMMKNAGLEVRHILNWVKDSPTFSMGRLDYDYQHEPILFTWTKTHKRTKGGAFHTSLWTVPKPRANKEHPTMKPVELPLCAILNHTDKGDVVVDMFGGSGTTMVAAENTKRRCRILELAPQFCAVTLQRMKDAFPNIETERLDPKPAKKAK